MNPVPLFLIIVTLPLFASGCVPKETDGRPQSWPGLQLGFPPPIWYKPSNYHGGKKYEANYKDGKLDGLWVVWHENEQKAVEANYKDGKVVEGSRKFWNGKGEEIDQEEGEKMLEKMQNEISEDAREFKKRLEPKLNQNNP